VANFVIHTRGSCYEKMPKFQTNFSVYISILTKIVLILISNFRGVLNVVFFLLGVPQCLNFMCRHLGTHCTILIGGVSRKNKRHVTVGVIYTGRGLAQK
jgi:hypothetical protein